MLSNNKLAMSVLKEIFGRSKVRQVFLRPFSRGNNMCDEDYSDDADVDVDVSF